MKRLLLTSALMCLVASAYAQKTELDAAQKAFDKGDYQTALTQAQKGQQMLDETSKPDMVAKAMYLVGLSKLQLAGDNREMIDQALEELNALAEYEKGQNFSARDNATKKTVYFDSQKELDDAIASGKYSKPKVTKRIATYTPQMHTTVGEFGNGYYQQSVNAFNSRDFKKAAELFELTYEAQKVFAPKADTALLNNAAISLLQARDYTGAKELYKRLIDMDYTGIETIYEATDALTGERRVYNSKEDMDMQVKLKLASDPEVRVEEDKQPGIYLLLIQLCYQDEEYDQALEYCQKALKKYPKDKDIFLLEGQIQYQKGDLDKFLENLLNAEKVFEGDAEIFYNIGFIYGEKGDEAKSIEYYKKAIEVDPKYVNAYVNLASTMLNGEQRINEEIDKLPLSLNAEQKKQYDELVAQKKALYKEVVDLLEGAHKVLPDELNIVRILRSVYTALDDQENVKKYEALEQQMMGM